MRPSVLLEVLRPLVIAYGHASGIGEEVGNHRNAALLENAIGRRRRRLVRAFDHNLAIDGCRICLFGDHTAQCGGHQPFAGDSPELFIRNALAVLPL